MGCGSRQAVKDRAEERRVTTRPLKTAMTYFALPCRALTPSNFEDFQT